MFAPYHSAQWGGCFAFLVAAVWAGWMGIMWARNVRRWTAKRVADGIGIALYVLVVTPVMIWFALPAVAQPPPPPNTTTGPCNNNAPNYGQQTFKCPTTINAIPVPWELTKAAADKIVAAVKIASHDFSSFEIRYAPMNNNARNFAFQLRQAFIDGGLTEHGIPTPLGIDLLGVQTIPSGNMFYIKDKNEAASVAPIMLAVRDSHIPVIRHIGLDPELPDRILGVTVGTNDVPTNSPDLLRQPPSD